jgi:hypothetical protein
VQPVNVAAAAQACQSGTAATFTPTGVATRTNANNAASTGAPTSAKSAADRTVVAGFAGVLLAAGAATLAWAA